MKEIQQMENDLISGKLGSDSTLYNTFIFKTEQLLGIKPTTKDGIEFYNTKLKSDLDKVLTCIIKGETITNAVANSGLDSVDFFGKISTSQMQMIQSLRANYKINNK